jgi:hypothetical protein
LITALVAVAFASCQKLTTETTTALPEPPPPVAVATPPPATVAIAAVEPPPPVAAPPSRELAPPGFFYLRAKKSITTHDGIIGLPPATGLREIAPGEYTTEGGHALKLESHEITNDLAEARHLASYNAAARAALSRSLSAAQAAEDAARTPPPEKPANAAAARSRTVSPRSRAQPENAAISAIGVSSSLGDTHSQEKAFDAPFKINGPTKARAKAETVQ